MTSVLVCVIVENGVEMAFDIDRAVIMEARAVLAV